MGIPESMINRCNTAQLVVDQQGKVIVPTYDWTGFLTPYFKKLPGIKKGHHFIMKSSHPGEVMVKDRADQTVARKYSLLREDSTLAGFPEVIEPAGLSPARQWYLHDKIREVRW